MAVKNLIIWSVLGLIFWGWMVQPDFAPSAEAAEEESWFERISLNADLRLRHESQFSEISAGDVPDRQRQRIRFRIGGKMHVLKNLDIGFRLVTGATDTITGTTGTGGGDPVSSNQTLGNTFETKGFQLDRAYAAYQYGPGKFLGGKFKNPFYTSQVVWDSDVSVEGLAQQFRFKATDRAEVFVTLGQFFIEELPVDEQDTYLLALQVGIEHQLADAIKAKLAIAYYDYGNIRGRTLTHATSGNTLGFGAEQNDYDILDILGEVTFDLGVPVKLLGQYVNNIDVASGNKQNTATHFGIVVGNKPRKLGDWRVRYSYRVVAADAVVDAFTHSDFHGGGTNSRGSEMGVDIGLAQGVALNFTYYNTQVETGPKDDRQRFQADLVIKFM